MTTKHYLLLALTMISVNAFSGQDRGGGDICEDRIQIVRDDLRNWIQKDGHEALRFPEYIRKDTYSLSMLEQIKMARVRCVDQGDEGYPVEVFGTPKICRFDKSRGESLITCHFSKFMQLSETEQYTLVHHEYAGLADIEKPNLDDSNYVLSNQISSNLEETVVKKLRIGRKFPFPETTLDKIQKGSVITLDLNLVVRENTEATYLGQKDRVACELRTKKEKFPRELQGKLEFTVKKTFVFTPWEWFDRQVLLKADSIKLNDRKIKGLEIHCWLKNIKPGENLMIEDLHNFLEYMGGSLRFPEPFPF